MRLHALTPAQGGLDQLVREVVSTGETVVITRGGNAVARLEPVAPAARSAEARTAASERLAHLQARLAARSPDMAPVSWDALKRWARDYEDDLPGA